MSSIAFCPQCHRETYRITEEGDNIKVTTGGKTIFNINRKSSVSVSLSCPVGHPNKLVIKPEEGK